MLDKLMELADAYANYSRYAHTPNLPDDARAALRTALDDALKPGELFGYVSVHPGPCEFEFHKELKTIYRDNCRDIHAVYTAPPAQTPPPLLTEDQIQWCWNTACYSASKFARTIESAVRRQFINT